LKQGNSKPYFKGFSCLKKVPLDKSPNGLLTIPAGSYFFRQNERSRIREARDLFQEQLIGNDSFLVIELEESLLSKTKRSQPIYELRLIVS